jgi:hypothetical protein
MAVSISSVASASLLILLLLLVVSVVRAHIGCVGNISVVELTSLQTLYESTNGANWHWVGNGPAEDDRFIDPKTIWSFPGHVSAPCGNTTWQGLLCNSTNTTLTYDGIADCYVSDLVLAERNLVGQIPSDLFQMTLLKRLDFNADNLFGSVPSEIGQLPFLEVINLNANYMTSTIPTEVGKLANLHQITANYNLFVGSLPTELSLLRHLEEISLEDNHLSGTIVLRNLSTLVSVFLDGNDFSGPLPGGISELSHLLTFSLCGSFVTGPLPLDYCDSKSVVVYYLYNNLLTGTLPTQLQLLTHLIELDLNGNYFSQTLPTVIHHMQELRGFGVSHNQISGTLPTEFGLLTKMQLFIVAANMMEGIAIPEEYIDGWHNMTNLYLDSNYFTGTISPKLATSFPRLALLDMGGNYISGSIPSNLWSLNCVTNLEFVGNLLTGSLPAIFNVNVSVIYTIELANNLFTSTLVDSLGDLKRLKSLQLEFNYYTGTVNPYISECVDMESLTVNSNLLSGTLPASFSKLFRLANLNMSSNLLTGRIDSLFVDSTDDESLVNGTMIESLQLLDLSLNALTGTLTQQLFGDTMPRSSVSVSHRALKRDIAHRHSFLSTVILHTNCFTGSLPDTICEATNLTALILDSASTAPACQVNFPPGLQDLFKVVIGKTLKGTIPDCIWSMPKLETFHVSGNGLVGSLVNLDGANGLGRALNDVSLASNALTGSIPVSWQTYPWIYLDLSANKLSGVLSDQFVVANNVTSMDLTVNRLSGDIPSVFQSAENINILDGNLFQCQERDKPANDPSSNDYICGSDDFNDSLIVFVCSFVLISLAVGYYTWSHLQAMLFSYHEKCKPEAHATSTAPTHISKMMDVLHRMRQLSVGLLGEYVCVAMVSFVSLKLGPSNSAQQIYSTHTYQYGWVTTVAYLHNVLPFVLTMLYLGVSVYAIEFVLRASNKQLIQQRRAFFATKDLFSKSSCYKAMQVGCLLLVHITVTVSVNVAYVYALIGGVSTSQLLVIQFFLGIFKLAWNSLFVNKCLKQIDLSTTHSLVCSTFCILFTFIAGPVIATFFSDTSCFRYIIMGQPAIVSTLVTPAYECILECEIQCFNVCGFGISSSTNTEVISVVPSWQYSYLCSSSLVVNYTPVLVYSYAVSGLVLPAVTVLFAMLVPSIRQKLPSWLVNMFRNSKLDDSMSSRTTIFIVKYQIDDRTTFSEPLNRESTSSRDLSSTALFDGVGLMSKLCLNIGVLVTFGLASPLLAIAVCVDSIGMSIVWKYLVGRFLAAYNDNMAWEQLEFSAKDITHGLPASLWMVVWLAGLFWCLFVFDMVGDIYGKLVGGIVMLCPTLGLSLVYWFSTMFNDWYYNERSNNGNAAMDNESNGVVRVNVSEDRKTSLSVGGVNSVVRGPFAFPEINHINEAF